MIITVRVVVIVGIFVHAPPVLVWVVLVTMYAPGKLAKRFMVPVTGSIDNPAGVAV